MQTTLERPIDLSSLDDREETLAMIRMIEFVRTNLSPRQKHAAENYLHAAIEGLSANIPRES